MIGVVGPGALGCLLAALLHEGGQQVLLLDYDPERAARLSAGGVKVSGPGQAPERVVKIPVTSAAEQLAAAELILLCVKAADTEAALVALAPSPSVSVLVFQNGLGRAERVAALLGTPERVLGGWTSEGATRAGEGVIRHAGRGETRIAPLLSEGGSRAQRALDLLRSSGLKVLLESDLRSAEWCKLQVNAAINALTCLLGCRNGGLLISATAAALADEVALEVGRVAAALEIPGEWSPGASRRRWRAVAEATADNISSSLQDLRRDRRTEVFVINAALAEAARAQGISAPVNQLLARLVEAREELQGQRSARLGGAGHG